MIEEEIPEICENPDEKCNRTPQEIVKYTKESAGGYITEKHHLCSPCSAMFYRGTTVRGRRSEVKMRKIEDD